MINKAKEMSLSSVILYIVILTGMVSFLFRDFSIRNVYEFIGLFAGIIVFGCLPLLRWYLHRHGQLNYFTQDQAKLIMTLLPDDLIVSIKNIAADGNRLGAIKKLRSKLPTLGLFEAKYIVEYILLH